MSRNISREKRENLLAKIRELRTFLESANATSEMRAYLSELESELKRQKFGLVFEEHKEEIDEILDTHTPVLTEDKNLFIDNGGTMNFLIEGDNLAALTLLEKTHKGKVDLIYIDPPYNTKNNDFKYDDKFVGADDLFKHSKWLSFMQKRLVLAKDLLSEKGFIFISIDDNELAQLKIICDNIFGENNYINLISLKAKVSAGASGGGEDKRLKKNVEYLLWYSKNREKLEYIKPLEKIKLIKFIEEHREDKIGFYYTRIIKNYGTKTQIGIIKDGSGEDIRVFKHENFEFSSISEIMRIENISEESAYTKYYKDIFMVTNAQTSILTRVNNFVNDKQCLISYEYTPKTGKAKGKLETKLIWNKTLVVWLKDTCIKKNNTLWKTQIKGTLWTDISWGRLDTQGNTPFKNGKKPIKLMQTMIELCPSKNITILDFFAGSCSTAHSVIAQNNADGGKRNFIMVTSNENNIAHDVGYKRVKNVIAEFGNNTSLKYQRIEFIPTAEQVYYDYANELLLHIRELVELENAINFEGNADLAILLTEDEMDKFFTDSKKLNAVKIIYLGHDIALSLEQQKILSDNNISLNIIPEYYYKEQQV